MHIPKGSIFGLLGMNGSGKSTTVRLILNEEFKSFGAIYFNGEEITSETSNIYEKMAISPQIHYLN